MNQADLIFNGTEAVFREGLISVENGICKRKPNIFKVCIPDSVLVIEDNAFYQCLNLKEVIFSSNLAEIGSQCFCYTKIKSLEFPDSLKVIGNSAFNSCKLLQEINMTDSVMDIGAGAFANCIALEKVVLSSSLTEISKQLFAACPSS